MFSLRQALLLLGLSSVVAAAPSNIKFGSRDLLSPCEEPLIKDASAAPTERWNAANAQDEFKLVNWQWAAEKENSPLNYSAYVAEYFDAKESMICENVGDGPCKDTVTCEEVSMPAGFFILNSFVQLHVLQSNIYEAFQDAMNDMQNSMTTFQETFSPPREEKDNKWLASLLDALQFGIGLLSGFSFNIALKTTSLAKDSPNGYGLVKDGVNTLVSTGFTMGKSKIPTAQTLQNDLATVMGEIFSYLIQAQVGLIQFLFSGDVKAVAILENLVRDGAALNLAKGLDRFAMIKEAQKVIYSLMLPLAWKNSPVEIKDHPERIFPMILMVPDDCVTSGENLHWMVDPEKSEKMAVCHDGHTFFVGFPTFTGYTRDDEPTRVRLWALPGGENEIMDGNKWAGLRLDDLVISAYDGYRKNGYRSGQSLNLTDSASDDDGILLGDGVRTPGLVTLPICTPGRVFSEARDLLPNGLAWSSTPGNAGKPFDGGSYPCGEGILTEDEMISFGFK
ncbi:hypothetical protein HJFPF1_13477 [Paramyrothecium foliicola]|nr:hypothetical protein HJFPF1_13477 [Paramyrothecium foliicola]